ncbi:type IV pilus modification PilV family protein [Heliorestis convoluta]|uniref:Prepilin-type N-terminal cleavage/methylation protein n=1 Tax=Heliorestis convoluta TaxID=356322 RepID=A0A5Q2MWD5_9FIRM|nr:type II secretion system protein [Heliorestis convoluta]QGG46577.1 prepilin-type N-terminal cleavage/methylation protein [Heliorestis convoluta]
MKTIKNLSSCKKGFSVVEVLISLVILTILIVAVAPLMATSFTGIMASGNRSTDLYQAQRELENEISELNNETNGSSLFEITFSDGSDNVTIEINAQKLIQDTLIYYAPVSNTSHSE